MVSTDPMATRCCWPPERVRRSGTQVGDPQQVQRLLDPAAHRLGAARAAPCRGQLLLDRVADEAGGRVPTHVADHVRPLARRGADDARAVEQHVPVEETAAEPRHQPGHDPEQGRLADAGGAETRTSSPSSTVRSTRSRTGSAPSSYRKVMPHSSITSPPPGSGAGAASTAARAGRPRRNTSPAPLTGGSASRAGWDVHLVGAQPASRATRDGDPRRDDQPGQRPGSGRWRCGRRGDRR